MSPVRRAVSVTIASALTIFGAYISFDWLMYGGKKVLALISAVFLITGIIWLVTEIRELAGR